jgi:hypothetical protein
LHNGIIGLCSDRWFLETFGETGDAELVAELLTIEPKPEDVARDLLHGAASAGHDELALQLLADFVALLDNMLRAYVMKQHVAMGGCVRTAAVISDEPSRWVPFLPVALRNGHQSFVEWVLADVELNAHASYVADAAESGSLEFVKWVHAKGYAVGGEALTNAAASGNLDLCKWVSEQGLVPEQNAMDAAVNGGHVQVLEWLSSKGCRCTSFLLRYALRTADVPVVAWCLDHHPHPTDAGDLLGLSCQNVQGPNVFEYLADQRGLKSSPTELMQYAAERHAWEYAEIFDAAILVKRYGIPLFPGYILEAIDREDLARLRFALSQGQEVSEECYKLLIENADATLLNEVLLARKVGDSIPEGDQALIESVLRDVDYQPSAKMVLADHSFFV